MQTVQEEIVQTDVLKKKMKRRKKVIKHHKIIKPTNNNEINDDSDSDDGINVIFPSVEEQRKIAKAVLCVADLRADEQWQNVAQETHVINENVHLIHEQLFKANKEMLPIKEESEAITAEIIPDNYDAYTSDQEAAIVNEVLGKTNKQMPNNTDEMRSAKGKR